MLRDKIRTVLKTVNKKSRNGNSKLTFTEIDYGDV